jgi:CubicO group peptidase (beta-lactamase class C family)
VGTVQSAEIAGQVRARVSELDARVESILQAARIPGAALAIVAGRETVHCRGYGYRDLQQKLPMTPATSYPIASTTKAMNATLLGTLVDEGKLAWDTPVQEYLPRFRLKDPAVSAQVTVRDLITMRTGLPRHDWLWLCNSIGRAELVERLRHLEPSAAFRERFQYNNLSVTAAGHVAEVITGSSWEHLVQQRVFTPLGMKHSVLTEDACEQATASYRENARRELIESTRFTAEVTAPSGGAIHSTIEDMALWVSFNLCNADPSLLEPRTLAEIHSPQMATRGDPAAPTTDAIYALGWFVDRYNGCARLSHSGALHDVNSDVMLLPAYGLGLVSFTNFGGPGLARLVNEHASDLIRGCMPVQTLDEKLALYEARFAESKRRSAVLSRVSGTSPSHPLEQYAGIYAHPAYGDFEVECSGQELCLRRHRLVLRLEHWHYDAWIAQDADLFPLHLPHAFDRASRLLFEADADGRIDRLLLPLEPALPPIRFRQRG